MTTYNAAALKAGICHLCCNATLKLCPHCVRCPRCGHKPWCEGAFESTINPKVEVHEPKRTT